MRHWDGRRRFWDPYLSVQKDQIDSLVAAVQKYNRDETDRDTGSFQDRTDSLPSRAKAGKGTHDDTLFHPTLFGSVYDHVRKIAETGQDKLPAFSEGVAREWLRHQFYSQSLAKTAFLE